MTLNNKNRNLSKYLSLSFGIAITTLIIIFTILDSNPYWFSPVDPSIGRINISRFEEFLGGFYNLFYFTFQTNYFLGISLVLYSFKNKIKFNTDNLLIGSVSLITITFLLYWTAIAPLADSYKWQNVYWVIENVLIHGVSPILGFSIMCIDRKQIKLKAKVIRWISCYVSCFIILAAILYAVGSTYKEVNGKIIFEPCYIYSFLDFRKPAFIPFNESNLSWAILVDILLLFIGPLIYLVISFIYTKAFKIQIDQDIFYFKKTKQNLQQN